MPPLQHFPYDESYLSAYLDNALDSDVRQDVEKHLAENTALQHQVHSLRAVKQLLAHRKDNIRPPLPKEVRYNVQIKLEQEIMRSTAIKSIYVEAKNHSVGDNNNIFPLHPAPHLHTVTAQQQTWRRNILNPSVLWERRTMLVAAVAVLAIGLTLLRIVTLGKFDGTNNYQPQEYSLSGNVKALQELISTSTFASESLQNFRAVTSGKIKLQYATSSFAELDKFFQKQGVTCRLVHPHIANATLLGGVVSEENGKKSAHLVFSHKVLDKEDLLYMWEIEETPSTIRHTTFSPAIWKLLQDGEWLWDTTSTNKATAVFWEDNTDIAHRTLCVVVSALPRTEMQPLFQQ